MEDEELELRRRAAAAIASADAMLDQQARKGMERQGAAAEPPEWKWPTVIASLAIGSISDAVTDLGKPEEIGSMFAGFQKYLNQEAAAA